MLPEIMQSIFLLRSKAKYTQAIMVCGKQLSDRIQPSIYCCHLVCKGEQGKQLFLATCEGLERLEGS